MNSSCCNGKIDNSTVQGSHSDRYDTWNLIDLKRKHNTTSLNHLWDKGKKEK